MPSPTFVLPHWLYWSTLIAFPLIAIYFVRRQRRHGAPTRPSLFIAYMFWLCAGFMGVHRLYLKSLWGFVFLPIFLAILYCNVQIRDAREDVSRTRAAVETAHAAVQRAEPFAGVQLAPEAAKRLEAAKAEASRNEREYAAAQTELDHWRSVSFWLAILMAAMLLLDAVLLPGAVRRTGEREAARSATRPAETVVPPVHEAGTGEDPTLAFHTRITDAIEWINVRTGEYVAYWAVISVFVYYYEVIARFVFNSPTNWVHESMFLMYGMQYMLSGAYAYREDQHVRVDVIYAKFSPRGKAIADIITSVFFFIFMLTLLWTGARFAWDSIQFDEHSFTEWGVQYWPIKLTMPIGAALMVLQGISKLIKDIMFVARRGA